MSTVSTSKTISVGTAAGDTAPSYLTRNGYNVTVFYYLTSCTQTDTQVKLTGYAGVKTSTNQLHMSSSTATVTVSSSGQTTQTKTQSVAAGTASSANPYYQTYCSSFTYTWTKGTSTTTKTVTIKLTFSSSSYFSADSATITLTVNIPTVTTYAITYSGGNGSSGTVSSQTKYHNVALALRSNSYTKTGYTFSKWKATNGTTYSAGGSYTTNAVTQMTAQWTANTYTVKFDAKGGTAGSTTSMSRTYGSSFTIPASAIPTRSNYNFLGWSTSSSATTATYTHSGTTSGTCTISAYNSSTTSPLTLYAVWELAYVKPVISNFQAYRVNESGNATSDGERVFISFSYTGGSTNGGTERITPTCAVTFSSGTHTRISGSMTPTSGSGTLTATYGNFSKDSSYTITVKLSDENYTTGVTKSANISSAIYPIDLKADNNGVVSMGIMTPAVSGQMLKILVDAIYPVGSYYETSDTSFRPATYFGGIWELESAGKVHVSAGTGYTIGSTGGSTTHVHGTKNHTLTIDEMPSHTHDVTYAQYTRGSGDYTASALQYTTSSKTTSSTGGGQAHNHGNTESGSSMPPYIVVNRWHRTA